MTNTTKRPRDTQILSSPEERVALIEKIEHEKKVLEQEMAKQRAVRAAQKERRQEIIRIEKELEKRREHIRQRLQAQAEEERDTYEAAMEIVANKMLEDIISWSAMEATGIHEDVKNRRYLLGLVKEEAAAIRLLNDTNELMKSKSAERGKTNLVSGENVTMLEDVRKELEKLGMDSLVAEYEEVK